MADTNTLFLENTLYDHHDMVDPVDPIDVKVNYARDNSLTLQRTLYQHEDDLHNEGNSYGYNYNP